MTRNMTLGLIISYSSQYSVMMVWGWTDWWNRIAIIEIDILVHGHSSRVQSQFHKERIQFSYCMRIIEYPFIKKMVNFDP